MGDSIRLREISRRTALGALGVGLLGATAASWRSPAGTTAGSAKAAW